MRPDKGTRVNLALVALSVFAWPINHAERAVRKLRGAANRAFGRALTAAGIRRDPSEGDDGSPK